MYKSASTFAVPNNFLGVMLKKKFSALHDTILLLLRSTLAIQKSVRLGKLYTNGNNSIVSELKGYQVILGSMLHQC